MTPEAELQRLMDNHLISRLKATYVRLVDEKSWSSLERLLADDFAFNGTHDGHEFVDLTRRSLADASTVHQLGVGELEVESPTTATGVWPFADIIDQRRDGLGAYRRGFGHYHETYVKASSGWRIAAMRIIRLRVECTVIVSGGEVRNRTCLSQEEVVAWLDQQSRL